MLSNDQTEPFNSRARLSRREILALLPASALAMVAAPPCLAGGASAGGGASSGGAASSGGGASSASTPSSAAAGTSSAALHFLSLEQLASRIASRALSPVDVTLHMLERIARLDEYLKSYATVTAEQALDDAHVAEREIRSGRYRGPLHGVPIGIKDLCYTKGVRTMGGTPVRRDFIPGFDATVVARLRSAGAIVLGKLNLSEGAAAGYNPAMDVPLNPWNPGRWPGMSSSGCGVALAAGLCYAAIGTDTGGSIRFPASADGVVGLKPTYGRVSRYGVIPMAESLDHVGPMARRVGDAALMFDAIAGFDPRDLTSLRAPAPRTYPQMHLGVSGLRIGIDRNYALKGIDAGQAAAIESALGVLRDLGARIVSVSMPDVSHVADIWQPICGHEMAQAYAATFPARAAEYGPYLREFLSDGGRVTADRLAAATRAREVLTRQLNALVGTVDAVACPAGGDPAWPITHAIQVGSLAAYHAAWSAAAPRAAEFTIPMDLAGLPAICLPSGFSSDGLPYSIQFMGRRLGEATLLRIASAYETATPWHERHPKVRPV